MREGNGLRVLLIIPAYNEEDNILRVVQRVREYRKTCPWRLDYVVINDGSTDATEQVCLENGIHHIRLLQNLGIGGAVQTGYLYAWQKGYDIAVQFDGDGQHDLNSLPQLLAPVVRGDCDFCVGSRFVDKSSDFQSTLLRRVGIQYLSWLIRLFTGTRVTDPTSGFRAANRAVIRDLAEYYPADYPEPESIVQIKKMRHRIQEVQVNMFEREGGQSSIRSWKSIYYMIKVSVAVVCASLQKGEEKTMTWLLRVELVVLAVVSIVVVIHAVNRRVLQLKYSLIWLLISLCLVIAALFPKIAFAVTALVGIETPSNLIFFLAIIALLGICFSLTVIVSRQETRIKRLIQILSIEHNEFEGSEEEENAATERDNK